MFEEENTPLDELSKENFHKITRNPYHRRFPEVVERFFHGKKAEETSPQQEETD